MGMFDHFWIDVDLLPIPEYKKRLLIKGIGERPIAQTKSMDNTIILYSVPKNKKLYMEEFETEITPRHQRPYPKQKNGISSVLGVMRHINKRTTETDYTGSIDFYYSIRSSEYEAACQRAFKNTFIEFVAFFKNGKLKKIYPEDKVPPDRTY